MNVKAESSRKPPNRRHVQLLLAVLSLVGVAALLHFFGDAPGMALPLANHCVEAAIVALLAPQVLLALTPWRIWSRRGRPFKGPDWRTPNRPPGRRRILGRVPLSRRVHSGRRRATLQTPRPHSILSHAERR
jgi:hypothetical protein